MKTYIQIKPAAKDFIKKLSKSKNKKEKKEALEVLEIIKKEDTEGFIELNNVSFYKILGILNSKKFTGHYLGKIKIER